MIRKHKWGWSLTLLSKRHVKVKLLYFRKFKSLSLQRHHYRSELWCFLFGRGLMELGDFHDCMEYYDTTHGFFNIEPHEWHRYLAVKRTLVLEVQYGRKCREDDIERV